MPRNAALNVDFEDGEITNRITAAAPAEPGALPLLSYLLTDMWAGMVKRGDVPRGRRQPRAHVWSSNIMARGANLLGTTRPPDT